MEFNGVLAVSYVIATILFILALGGLSNQETARRGNWYGIIGMAIALVATIWGIVTEFLRRADHRVADRRQHRPHRRETRADDADARTRRDPATAWSAWRQSRSALPIFWIHTGWTPTRALH